MKTEKYRMSIGPRIWVETKVWVDNKLISESSSTDAWPLPFETLGHRIGKTLDRVTRTVRRDTDGKTGETA